MARKLSPATAHKREVVKIRKSLTDLVREFKSWVKEQLTSFRTDVDDQIHGLRKQLDEEIANRPTIDPAAVLSDAVGSVIKKEFPKHKRGRK